MKNKTPKTYLFLLLMLYAVLGFTQSSNQLLPNSFPSSWVGDWAGELQIFKAEGMTQSLPMQLLIQPIDNSTDYSFTIIYGLDIDKGTRSYVLKTIDASKGHYVIDEQNSIIIDAYLLGEKLVQRFEVMGNLLETFVEKRGDTLVWEIFSGKHEPTTVTGDTVQDGEDIPRVKAFPMGVYQKCVLTLIN